MPLTVGVSTRGEMETTGNLGEAETREAKHQRRLMHCRTKVLSNCSVGHSSPWHSLTKAMFTRGKERGGGEGGGNQAMSQNLMKSA